MPAADPALPVCRRNKKGRSFKGSDPRKIVIARKRRRFLKHILRIALGERSTGIETDRSYAVGGELPRERGRRPDVVILIGGTVLVLEFKDYRVPLQAHIDQVAAYARDLRNYHAGSRGATLVHSCAYGIHGRSRTSITLRGVTFMRKLIPFFFTATAAFCQPFSAGVKVGVPLTDFLSTVNGTTSATTNRYLIGVTAELHLPLGLGIEGDAIYRHFSFQNILTIGRPVDAGGSGTSTVTQTGSNGRWEFPLLLKYRFPAKSARPFIDGGVVWDTLTGVSNATTGVVPVRKTVNGLVLGAGIDVHYVIHIVPEFRFTHWTDPQYSYVNAQISQLLGSKQNQAEFMVGITF